MHPHSDDKKIGLQVRFLNKGSVALLLLACFELGYYKFPTNQNFRSISVLLDQNFLGYYQFFFQINFKRQFKKKLIREGLKLVTD